MSDFPAYCARPACRAEIRSGRRYCSTECEQAARGELDAARARLRVLTSSLRQASADLLLQHFIVAIAATATTDHAVPR